MTPEQKEFDSLPPANPDLLKFDLPPNFIVRIDYAGDLLYIKHNVRGCGRIFVGGPGTDPNELSGKLFTHNDSCGFTR